MDPQGPQAAEMRAPAQRDLDIPPSQLPAQAGLFLDFDGTLVDLIDRPDAVQANARVRDLVAALAERLDGRLAIVTGRDADFVRKQLGLQSIGIAGSHGQEIHFADGRSSVPEIPLSLADVAIALDRLAQAHQGLLVERKPLGVALHYRMVPELEAASLALASELAEAHGLYLQPGKMMVELRARGGDKGSAVARFLETPLFDRAVPIMLGDDLTDEPGFAAAAAHGGWGVLVGPLRRTSARYRLEGVGDVLDWLERAIAPVNIEA
ncbi:MAG: trehalose-phosphatase [Novosphingobium sp.]|uniref:trehalose-phosphatase n=1 Tax=Novosphingobium sp. TaxID=1874826 RepID=UPI003B9C5A5B